MAVQRPILTTETIHGDGSRHLTLRVYCAPDAKSVTVDTCRECSACAEIAGDLSGMRSWVMCDSTSTRAVSDVIASNVGSLLQLPTLCLRDDVPVRDLPTVFLQSKLPALFVVDSHEVVVGSVPEMSLLRAGGAEIFHRAGLHERSDLFPENTMTAAQIMSSACVVHDHDSVHRALREMAHTHSRQVAVLSEGDHMVGTLQDLEAIRALHRPTPKD